MSNKINKTVLVGYLMLFCAVILQAKRVDVHPSLGVDSVGLAEANSLKALPDWTIMVYMQAKNNLASFAGGNIKDMATFANSDDFAVVTQWDQPGKKGAWRYCIKKSDVSLANYSEVKNPKDCAERLVDFVQWAHENYPAKKYCLVLWNHGVGAVDPSYGDPLRVFVQNRDLLEDPRFNIEGFMEACYESPESFVVEPDCQRGVMFDEDNRVFLTNQGLKEALETITSHKVLGKKIDCLGFDACYMSAAEVAYQVKDYADYMVASEELELARGWNYSSFISKLAKSKKTPSQLASDIVEGYKNYYKGHTQYYTLASVDLSRLERVKKSVDDVATRLESCIKKFGRPMVAAIKKSRHSALQFTTKFYVDLHSLFSTLITKVSEEEGLCKLSSPCAHKDHVVRHGTQELLSKYFDPELICLIKALREGVASVESAVVSSVASNHLSHARGLSIYFPTGRIVDSSYNDNDFASGGKWQSFLKTILSVFQYH